VILDKEVLAVELAQQDIIREDNERNIRIDYNNAGCAKPLYLSCIFAKKFVTMPVAEALPQPFTNLQLELLKIYARTVDEKDLLEIKRLLGQYFAGKASDLADKLWAEKGLSEAEILNKHRRTPYPRRSSL